MIGIFGGTFDPIHNGHLRAALEVKERLGLDKLHLIPCAQPAHRTQPEASASMRLHMVQLALENRPGWIADNREVVRGGTSYMVDTLASLRADYPLQPLVLFIGTDAFMHLTAWKHWQSLFNYAHVVVVTRPGYAPPALNNFFSKILVSKPDVLAKNPAGQLYFQAITPLDISATAIRQMIAAQGDPSFLMPSAVISFIKAQKLYTHPNN